MAIRVGINGFGRIGRLVYRIGMEQGGIEFVGVNDLVPSDNLGYLVRHDTCHGRFSRPLHVDGDTLVCEGVRTKCSAIKDPAQPSSFHGSCAGSLIAQLPWKELGCDLVLEASSPQVQSGW